MIEVKNLSQDFYLTDQIPLRVLDNINLVLPSGRSTAITGASGSGKSTLLALMAGLERPTSGSVSVLEQDLGRLSEDDLSAFRGRHLGFVFQNFQLMAHFDALTNVALAAQICGLDSPHDRARAALEQVGLSERLHHLPTRLSGGECQRVALARALVKRPEILLCDEPTGNLDPETAEQIFELLMATCESHGATVILVTHDPDLAARCSTRVVLNRGRIGRIEGCSPP